MSEIQEYEIDVTDEVDLRRGGDGGTLYTVYDYNGRGYEASDAAVLRDVLPWVADLPSRNLYKAVFTLRHEFPSLVARVRADPRASRLQEGELLALHINPRNAANKALLTLARERGVTVGELLETLE